MMEENIETTIRRKTVYLGVLGDNGQENANYVYDDNGNQHGHCCLGLSLAQHTKVGLVIHFMSCNCVTSCTGLGFRVRIGSSALVTLA